SGDSGSARLGLVATTKADRGKTQTQQSKAGRLRYANLRWVDGLNHHDQVFIVIVAAIQQVFPRQNVFTSTEGARLPAWQRDGVTIACVGNHVVNAISVQTSLGVEGTLAVADVIAEEVAGEVNASVSKVENDAAVCGNAEQGLVASNVAAAEQLNFRAGVGGIVNAERILVGQIGKLDHHRGD